MKLIAINTEMVIIDRHNQKRSCTIKMVITILLTIENANAKRQTLPK